MKRLKNLSQAELAQVFGGAYQLRYLQLVGWSHQAAPVPPGPNGVPGGGGIPGGPLAIAASKYCAEHPGGCNNIPPTQPRD